MRSSTPESAPQSGLLSVVGTPIGNLEDITLRALRTLREADTVVAEDTRHTRALLTHHGIEARLTSMHAHSGDAKVAKLVSSLEAGAHLALVSDAGCPVLSDPGGRLIAAAREAGVRIESVPGPSALTAGLSVAGLRAESFRFVGFLPRAGGRRKRALHAIAEDESASVIFESPRRLAATLGEFSPLLGDRRLAVCRELTKLHEEVRLGTAQELLEHFAAGARGEITLLVEAGESSRDEEAILETALEGARGALKEGRRIKDIARELASKSQLTGQEAYARVRALRAEVEGADG